MHEELMRWFAISAQRLQRLNDTSAVLDAILAEARQISSADAGTVFLVEGEDLVFAYTHNDTLFPVETAYKYAYANARMPINPKSIAGACAVACKPINLQNVRQLPKGVPFSFNETFDESTGYRTVSMLSLPLIGRENTPIGVLQLINSLNDAGQPQAFDSTLEPMLSCLCIQAVAALERSKLAEEMIRRMLSIVSLTDPMETGQHVERVGAVASELYQRWAERNSVPIDERKAMRSRIRLAAMLHDVGKVAIPHQVLKKPGKLTDEEFEIIKKHCAFGQNLFQGAQIDIDLLAREISVNHHQKWNGKGYTGSDALPILAGTAIPLGARLTAVADVFDALVSPRCYKKPWTWEDASTLLLKEKGIHFDPEIVDIFIEIQDLIKAVYRRYPVIHLD